MKTITAVLCCLIINSVGAQFSFSIGATERLEGYLTKFDPENEDENYGSWNNKSYELTNNSSEKQNELIGVSLDYRKKKIVVIGQLYFLKNSYSSEATVYSSTSSGGSGFWVYGHGISTYTAKVQQSYIGVKLSGCAVIVDKQFTLLMGPYINVDFLVSENEQNHFLNYSHTTSYSYGNFPDNVTTSSSNEEFDAVTPQKVSFSVGLQIKPRLYLSNFFVELPLSPGISFFPRKYENRVGLNNEGPYSYGSTFGLYPNLEIGLNIGYTFNKKVKKSESE